MHTLFLNEHNRIANLLHEQYPSLSDEEIYQVARRLVKAQLQNVVYNEFLPTILGNSTMEDYNLNLKQIKHESKYDPSVNPSISNEFATFAFRFGHTLVPLIFRFT